MRLTYLTIFCTLIALTAAAPSSAFNESEEEDTDSESLPFEYLSDELSAEDPSKVNRRSLGFLFGTHPYFNPLRSFVPCRHPHRRWHSNYRHHHHPHSHRHHIHPHQHGHWPVQYQPPVVVTPPAPTPRFSTAKTTPSRGEPNDRVINPTVPTTLVTIPTTRLIPSTTTSTTFVGQPTPTTATSSITSSSTPRYNDPDNELIYDIDLRFST